MVQYPEMLTLYFGFFLRFTEKYGFFFYGYRDIWVFYGKKLYRYIPVKSSHMVVIFIIQK